ncbi:hypothetical protein [Limisphaera sp. VF-2]|uniref:hypothetical protein n=1 Tax=Limisphaera sp. VF-2 TaxID=3400418 RepID=UPI0017694DAB
MKNWNRSRAEVQLPSLRCAAGLASAGCRARAGLCAWVVFFWLAYGLGQEADRVWVIQKVPVADCRVVRGFVGAPVDGSVHSRDYSGRVAEYPARASDGVQYSFNGNDGVHLTLADERGFDWVVLRGGARTRMYAGRTTLVEPTNRSPLHVFRGGESVQIARFPQRVQAQQVSFFGTTRGALAEVGFYRLARSVPPAGPVGEFHPGEAIALPPPSSAYAPENLLLGLQERYAEPERQVRALLAGDPSRGTLRLPAHRAIHLVTPAFLQETGLAAISVAAAVADVSEPVRVQLIVQDPLNPRRDISWVEWEVEPGRLDLVLDLPDQVVLPGSRLWITLRASRELTLTGPSGGAPAFRVHFVPVEQARPEALAWRKFLLKTLFSVLSEPRPWGSYGRQPREEFYASSPYAAQCPELFLTLDQCHALAPQDELIRQYREWVYLRHLPSLSPVSPPPPPPEGVPAWAWYPRLAWLEARRIAQWWLDERLVDTGELGGRVGDDTDWFQQFVDLPFFEDGGTAAQLREAAARLAELADRENLREGINRESTDALHAYEEGINHLALMARWFYGDPVYLERCMDSARNLEKLTIRTEDGRRFFRDSDSMGARDLDRPRPPKVDGHAAPLMWHAALQWADYNRAPEALRVVREWADTWLRYLQPGQWATAVEVPSGRILAASPDQPLGGGYRAQATVFTWLYALTGDARYIEPFLHYLRQGRAPAPTDAFLNDLFNLGALRDFDAGALGRLATFHPALPLYLRGDPKPLIDAAVGNPQPGWAEIACLYDARRWPDMYTVTHQFTDRVFPSLLQHASIAYLGGFTRRNKFNPTQAVSWEGFGTNYAALVLVNQPDRFKALVYSFAKQPMRGRLRFWALARGRYRVTVGRDADHDQQADRVDWTVTRPLARAEPLDLVLAPRTVTVIEVTQTETLEPLWPRPDLALSPREVLRDGRGVSGVIHNLGTVAVPKVEIAVQDAQGRIVSRLTLGPLAAPVDLVPKRQSFHLVLPRPPGRGWKLVADPEDRVPEIYEGNNAVPIP